MDFYLIALTGPLKGQRLALGGTEEWTLGRHRANRLRIPELAVSRRHAVLSTTPEGWRLRDLDSRGGTFVNGRPVGETELTSGDLVVIAGSTFLFTRAEAVPDGDETTDVILVGKVPPVPESPNAASRNPASPNAASPNSAIAPEIADFDLEAETALHLAVDDSLYLRGSRGATSGESRRVRALAALLAIGLAVEKESELEPLAATLLERTLGAVPAERAALVFLDGAAFGAASAGMAEGGDVAFHESTVICRQPASAPRGEPLQISRTVLERVARQDRALFWSRAAGRGAAAESVVRGGIQALAALPLGRRAGVSAVLYLDMLRPGSSFTEEDRDLLMAIAAMGGAALDTASRCARLERENRRLREAELGPGLMGESAPMRRVWDLLSRVAPTESTLLILGESGTGKELAARAVHAKSSRSEGPFIAVNCATLSENLLESELFGHEKGAFTGAVARKPGKLELAAGGTLFLDEVGELPQQLQARLLRVLQERVFERVGGTRPLRADVRLLAATNRDLAAAIRQGRFREDLYYRLNVISVTLPPLRERRGDVGLLARYFAALHGQRIHGRSWGVSAQALALLGAHPWPGNVRELSNAVERAVVLGQDDLIRPEDLPETLLEGPSGEVAPEIPRFHDSLNRLKRHLIVEAVAASEGNVTRAAERLGLHPNHLHRLITSLGLREEISR